MNLSKIIGILTFFVAFSAVSFAQGYPLRYCSESVIRGVGEDYSETVYDLAAAIKLDAAKIQSFAGGKITSVKIGTIKEPKDGGAIKTVKDLKIFIRSSLTGENLYLQSVDAFTLENLGGWYEVVLDKPFALDGQDIYVGYTLKANSIPLGFDDSKTPDSRATWLGINDKWMQYAECGNANIQAMISSDKLVPRKVLLQHFTTTSCGQCPAVHSMLEGMLSGNKDVVWVSHHAGFLTGDSYTTSVDTEHLRFYNSSAGTYAPAIMFDRAYLADYGAMDGEQNPAPGPVFFPATKEMAEAFLSIRATLPSFVKVDMDGTYASDSRKLTVKVYGKVTMPELLGANPTINVFLTQDGIVDYQNNGGKDYVHNRVFRAAITGAWGEELKVESDGTYSKTYEYTLNEKWVPENMNVIAFIGNVDSKDVNNCEVYNANAIKLAKDFTGIDSTVNGSVSMFANGLSIVIEGDYTSACIYDATGKLLKEMGSNEKTCQVDKGIYIVKVQNGEQTLSKKIAVK